MPVEKNGRRFALRTLERWVWRRLACEVKEQGSSSTRQCHRSGPMMSERSSDKCRRTSLDKIGKDVREKSWSKFPTDLLVVKDLERVAVDGVERQGEDAVEAGIGQQEIRPEAGLM